MMKAVCVVGVVALMLGGCTSPYLIDSDPRGALVSVDGKVVGTTPVTVQLSLMGTPQTYLIKTAKAGYQTDFRTVDNVTDFWGKVKWPDGVMVTLVKEGEEGSQ